MAAIVETTSGRIESAGGDLNGVHCFRGIPYAAPPVGELRFQSPQPPKPWAGVREAGDFGPVAHQNPMILPLPGMELGAQSEDCLYLNVWTPAADAARRPVLVWIHGGAFILGAGSQAIYDGAALARRGDAVVVTINYRLGPLGFLFLQDLLPGLPGAVGNEGIQDQVAALRWVRENIAAFGGDPENVTIFGESAGGMSVGTLLGMPSARGLFRRAVAQSGATHNYHDRETATAEAAEFLAGLGIEGPDAARKVRELPPEKLLARSQITFQTALGGGRRRPGLLPFQPVVDGESLPRPPLEALRDGAAADVSLMTGTTLEEWKLFGMLDPDVQRLDEAGLEAKLATRIPGADAAALLRTYRGARAERGAPTDPVALFFAIETDRIFRLPAIRLAEAQSAHQSEVFMYRFDFGSPAFDGKLGACHAIELPFVFGNHAKPWVDKFVGAGPEVDGLAGRTMDAWLAFARAGDPSHAGLPEAWPAYDTARRGTQLLALEPSLALAPDDAERAFWAEHL